MAKSANKLNAVLQDTADAIRSKTGSNGLITPRDFADEIDSIQVGIVPSGSLAITANGQYDVSAYAQVNVNVSAQVEMVNPGSSNFTAIVGNIKTAKTEVGQSFQWVGIPLNIADGWDYHLGVKFSNYDNDKSFVLYVRGDGNGKALVEILDSTASIVIFSFHMPKGYYFKLPYFWNGGDSCYIREWKNGIWYSSDQNHAILTSAY